MSKKICFIFETSILALSLLFLGGFQIFAIMKPKEFLIGYNAGANVLGINGINTKPTEQIEITTSSILGVRILATIFLIALIVEFAYAFAYVLKEYRKDE